MKNYYAQASTAFFARLSDFEKEHCTENQSFQLSTWNKLCDIYKDMENTIEQIKTTDHEALKEFKAHFKKQYYQFAQHSEFNKRVIMWPKGYQGDNVTLEYVYKGYPISNNLLGKYIDLYGIGSTLGVGIRERKDILKQLLLEEMFDKSAGFQRILNVGCGSSKELYDIGLKLNELNGEVVCLDYDAEALEFSEVTLASRKIDMKKIHFIRLNVLKLVDVLFMKEVLGSFDIIYSVGLFDYIQDKGLEKIFRSLYMNLNKNGKIIASFKDSDYYSTFDYHWVGNWDGFYQRTKKEVVDLLSRAMPQATIQIIESTTKAINYFVIKK